MIQVNTGKIINMKLRRCLRCGTLCRRKACLSCSACLSMLTLMLVTRPHWSVQRWFLSPGGLTYGNDLEHNTPLETQGRIQPRLGIDHTHCPTSPATTLFYMRIPKCASTSFTSLLKALSTMSDFSFVFDPRGAYNWGEHEMHSVAQLCQKKVALKRKLLYARHLYYLDFTPFGLKHFTYATVIREPVARVVSSYLYYHFSPRKHIQHMLDLDYRNETLQSCLQHQHNGCEKNLMTKYFCGHFFWCRLGSDQALGEAKKNLRNNFAVVGIVENMELTFEVMKGVLPQFFGQAHQEALPSQNRNSQTVQLSEAERRQVAEANAADVELYSYAVQLLHEKAKQCGLRDRF